MLLAWATAIDSQAGTISITDYPSPQEAINANPGTVLYVPPGIHRIEGAIHLTTDGSGLRGPGTIEQAAPGSTIMTVEKAVRVRLEDITLTRSEGTDLARGPGTLYSRKPPGGSAGCSCGRPSRP